MNEKELSQQLSRDSQDLITPGEMREKIFRLETAMKAMKSQLIHIEPTHSFVPGIYMREIRIPKGVTLTGEIHKTEHLCILSEGEVSVWTEGGMKRLKASSVVHSMPGIKRVLYAHEDSVWINVHHNPNNERDLDKIEAYYVTKTFEEYLDFVENKKQIELKNETVFKKEEG